MGLIDFILNVVALLLWLNWRSMRFDPLTRRVPATLVGTLRPAEPHRLKGWQWLGGLALLLVLRAVVYCGIGSPVHWTPRLDLGLVAPALRSDKLQMEFLYSGLSFLRVVIIFYFWLMVLAAINHRTIEPDPLLKLIRLHLGRSARWPWSCQVLLPVLLAATLWVVLQPLLVHLGLTSPARSTTHVVERGMLIGIGLFFTLKFLLPALLFCYFISSYVYLGANPFWDFVSASARNVLAPLKWLRVARLDLAPVGGIVLVVLVLHVLPHFILGELARRNLTLWPQ